MRWTMSDERSDEADRDEEQFPVIPDGGVTKQPDTPLEIWRYCVRHAAYWEQKAAEAKERGLEAEAADAEKRAAWCRRFAALWEGLAKETRNRKDGRP
jgi:hypothetical protein